MLGCDCPLPAALSDITPVACGENIGQIVKIIFQRRQAAEPFPTFEGAVLLGADLKASWDVFTAAVDSTKAVVSPYLESVVLPASEAITEGGDDNTTLDGVAKVVGATSPEGTGMIRSLPAAQLKQLKTYNCEEDLTIYLINEFGKIIGTSSDGTQFGGIPINDFFIGDGGNEGKNTADKTPFRFGLVYGWRDNLAFCKPDDFSARNDLP
jgi:hypothetical protein